jgi:hypothetical protein
MRILTAGAAALAVLLAPSPALATTAAQAKSPALTVVAQHLNNPRGLDFGPDGALYVAEAGKGGAGPCFPSPEGGDSCFGTSGSLARIKNGAMTRVLTGLPSMADPNGSNAIGPSDVSFHGVGLLTIGLAANPDRRDQLPAAGKKMGGVYKFAGGTVAPKLTLSRVADIAAYEKANNPDGGEVDSNPQSVVASPGGMAVSDAGGNTLLGVKANGTVKTLAVFPDRLTLAPPFLGLPPGTEIPFQAVPTGVAYHQGAFYVAQLTGFPFPQNAARIYRVVPGQAPTIVAAGFTNLIDVQVADDGTIYALEIAHDGLLSPGASGRLLMVRPGHAPVTIVSGLTYPGGLSLHDGYAYISDCGVCAGGGQVVRVHL